MSERLPGTATEAGESGGHGLGKRAQVDRTPSRCRASAGAYGRGSDLNAWMKVNVGCRWLRGTKCGLGLTATSSVFRTRTAIAAHAGKAPVRHSGPYRMALHKSKTDSR